MNVDWNLVWNILATAGWVLIAWEIVKAVLQVGQRGYRWFYATCAVYVIAVSVLAFWEVT